MTFLPRRIASVGRTLVLVLAAGISIYPLLYVTGLSLQTSGVPISAWGVPTKPTGANYERAWKAGGLGNALMLSLVVAISVVVLVTVISLLAAYALSILRIAGRKIILLCFLAGIVLPVEAIVVPLYGSLRDLRIIGTPLALIIPETALMTCFGIYWLRSFFLSMPETITEAAALDGASSWRTLWSVLVPNGKSAILTLVVLVFMWSWNEFFLALIFLGSSPLQTAPLGLLNLQGTRTTDLTGLAAGALMVAFPVIVLYAILQRNFVRGILAGAVKE